MGLGAIDTAGEVEKLIRTMYGVSQLPAPRPKDPSLPAILHVTAVHLDDSRRYKVIRVDDAERPKSEHDFFALNLARARADAIITSGKVIRQEEGVTHNLQGSAAKGLQQWRSQVLGKAEPPYSLIFTRGAPDLNAAIFQGDTRPIIYTTTKSATELTKAGARERGIIVVDGKEEPIMHEALMYLRRELGVETVSMEAGPSVSNALYDESLVSELMLSVHRGDIEDSAVGDDFKSPGYINERLEKIGETSSEDGWEFSRYIAK